MSEYVYPEFTTALPLTTEVIPGGDPRRTFWFGNYKIAGIVRDAAYEPVQQRVRLMDAITGRVMRSMMSNADGTYEFLHVPYRRYTVMGVDTERNQNAVVVDWVLPVAMD